MNTGGLRLRLVFLLAVVLLLGVGMVGAQASEDVVPEGLEYRVEEDGSVTITGFTGGESALILPAAIEGKPVRTIGYEAFRDNTSLLGIIIKNGVTRIDGRAFYGCTNLNSISIPQSVSSIGYYAFFKCSSLSSISLPAGLTMIDSGVFCLCINLTSITIPEGVASIGFEAFGSCSSMTSINVPDSVLEIGEAAFRNSSISTIIIPNGVTNIEKYTFQDCINLSTISLPSTITSIGRYAFSQCKSLNSLVLPKELQIIDDFSFDRCSGLTSIKIPSGVKSIGELAFYECKGLTSVTIPTSVKSIGSWAFGDCHNLKSLTIPINVISFGDNIFRWNSQNHTIRSYPYSAAEKHARDNNINFEALPIIQATGINLSSQGFSLKAGEKFTLSAQVSPENATYKEVTWSSSNSDVAMVTADGQVMAVTTGHVLITAKAKDGSNVMATCPVSVLPANEGMSLSPSAALVPVGNSEQLKAQPAEAGASLPELNWTSSKEAVATVDQNGLVTGVAPGAAIITASATDGSGMMASSGIQVYQSVTSISLEPEIFHLEPGASLTLVPQIQPESAVNKSLVWSSSDEVVATVDVNGLVTALLEGKSTITAKTQDGSGQQAESQLTVSRRITKISLDKTQLTLNTDETQTLNATIQPEDTTDKTLAWSSSDETVATVNQEGLVTGVKPGEATITATAQDGSDESASCEVTVVLTGDADDNDKLEIADLLCVIDYLVNGIECPAMDKADTNGNEAVDVNDLIYILDRLIP